MYEATKPTKIIGKEKLRYELMYSLLGNLRGYLIMEIHKIINNNTPNISA